MVGQDVSLGKCVLLSTSKAVRRAMKLWDISGEGGFSKVQLDGFSEIWEVILISLIVLVLVLFLIELVSLFLKLLRLVLCLWYFRSSWV